MTSLNDIIMRICL